MQRFLPLVWCGAVLAILGAGCSKETPPIKREVVRPVKIHRIGSLTPEAVVEYPGTIKAHQTAELGFEVPGRIIEFLVEEGDQVKKGQLLARLDPRDYEAQLRVAQANLEKAQADLQRNENIFKEDPGAISQDEIEKTRRAVKVSQAQLDIAKKALADTRLLAPFDGVVARKLVEDYANVLAKQRVLILHDLSELEIDVAVPERDVVHRAANVDKKEWTRRLQPQVIVSALPARRFPARIKEFAMTADPVTRTFSLTLAFAPPTDVTILPGMTARVRIVVDPDAAFSVPVSAVGSDPDKRPWVWKIDPQTMTVSKCYVKLGPLTRDRVLLVEGVKKGDLVAVSGVRLLRPGMKVREFKLPAQQEEPPPQGPTPAPSPAAESAPEEK